MGSNFNFRNYGNGPGGEGRPPLGNSSLGRQGSLYSLTFDELQNTMGGSLGKDFGSMNMDELLKSIWNAEETQTLGAGHSGAGQGAGGGGYLQRQGSLTLPRTLSQRTVDEVWKDMSKEFGSVKDGNGVGGSNMPPRQYTLGETTLEEFLVRAGVVREDVQLAKNQAYNNTGVFGDLALDGSNSVLNFGFQQGGESAVMTGGKITGSSNQMVVPPPTLPLNINGVRSNQQDQVTKQPQLEQHQQKQQTIFPKQPTLAYGPLVTMSTNVGLGSPRVRNGTVKNSDQGISNSLVQNVALQGGGMGMLGLGGGGVTIANSSPAVSSNGIGKSNGDLSSISPVPYVFNGGFRGRKPSTLEKVVERRQRRMIKNRESAARSRSRKQAYTMELEAEVAKLKEENEELEKKQAEMMEMQENQVAEMVRAQSASKRRSLRRTQTSPL